MHTSTGIDERIAAIAATQRGHVTHGQLRALGLTTSAISYRVRRGRLHRVQPGVYSVGHAFRGWDARVMAAVLATGPVSFASGTCATRLWGVYERGEPGVEVTSTKRHRGLIDAAVRFSRHPDPRDIRVHLGIPLSSVVRAAAEMGDTHSPLQVAHTIHQAKRLGLASDESFEHGAERLRFRNGGRVLASALDLVRAGSAGTRSDAEDRFHDLVLARRLPLPHVNVRIRVGRRHIEPDFRWAGEALLVVEIDGATHRDPGQLAIDRRNTDDLQAAGYHVERFVPSRITDAVDFVERWLAGDRPPCR